VEARPAGTEPVRPAGRHRAPLLRQAAPDVAGAAEGSEVKRMPTRVEGSFREPDTHQRSGQSQGIAPTSPRLGCAEGRSPFAGSARVSLDSSFYPPRAGARGLIGNAWHSLCRDFWIPASAEMAGQVQQHPAGSLRVSLNSSFHSPMIGGQGVDRECMAQPPERFVDSHFHGNARTGAAGCCRGLGCPQILYSPPKIEDPPQEEWGPEG